MQVQVSFKCVRIFSSPKVIFTFHFIYKNVRQELECFRQEIRVGVITGNIRDNRISGFHKMIMKEYRSEHTEDEVNILSDFEDNALVPINKVA